MNLHLLATNQIAQSSTVDCW